MIYSPQMLNMFQECPVKYFFRYVRNIQTPILESSFVVGKNIHAIAAYYLKGEDISMFELSEKESVMWKNLLNSSCFNFKTVRVESSIMTQIANYWIGGRLDALVKNENDDYFILDYKTGQIPKSAKDNFQTIVYLLCCDKLFSNRKSLNFTYINVKTGETENICFSDEYRKKYLQKIEGILAEINKLSEPLVNKSAKCLKCPYSKICV